MKITLNQEEFINAMNLRPQMLTEIFLLRQDLDYLERAIQTHTAEEAAKVIRENAPRITKAINKLEKLGIYLGNFNTTYMQQVNR